MKLQMQSVSFTYSSGVQALDDIDLDIESGEILAIVGENGAGKTTLVKLLNGLLKPSQGKVWVGDWDTSQHSVAELAGRVGFLFQNPDEQLFERTAQREVAFGPRNLGLATGEVEARTRQALDTVGLQDKAEVNPYDMQPFERKLLALASTLAMQAPVLVVDEPTTGQDAAGRQRIAGILSGFNANGGTVVLISHDLDFCAALAHRAVVMANGHILADGRAEDVFTQDAVLHQAAVFPPQLVRLAHALKMVQAPLSVQGFVDAYAESRKKQ